MDENQVEGGARKVVGLVKDVAGGITGDAKTQVEGKVDQVVGEAQSQFGAVKEQLSETVAEGTNKVTELAGRAKATVMDAAQNIGPKASEIGEKIYEATGSANRAVGSLIEKQPLAAILLAAVAGYGVSFLLHSPNSPFYPEPAYRRVIRRVSKFG